MMAWYAECGIRRIYWIHYHDMLLTHGVSDRSRSATAWAALSARRHGMEFYAQLRVFETGLVMGFVPHGVPLPEDQPAAETPQGRSLCASPFIREHPEMRIARRPGAWMEAPGRRVGSVKLVKSHGAPTRVGAGDLSLWTSEVNGRFRRYGGPVAFCDAVEQRDGRPCRVLTLGGLDVPAQDRFLLVWCSQRDGESDFCNAEDRLMELRDPQGRAIPSSWDQGLFQTRHIERLVRLSAFDRYGDFHALDDRIPRGRFGLDPDNAVFSFNHGGRPRTRALNGEGADGYVAHFKGKNPTVPGALNPAHPEVRAFWLEWVRAAIDAGADGVTVRILNHSSWTQDKEEYGYNAPAMEEYRRRHGDVAPEAMDFQQIRRINGEAFTLFLREARGLLHARGRQLQAHVCSWLGDEDRVRNSIGNFPYHFAFEWERWIEEGIVDSVLLKPPAGSYGGTRPRKLPDEGELDFLFSVAARAKRAGKAVVFESRLPIMHEETDEGAESIRQRIGLAWGRPDMDAVNLYEGASVMSMDKQSGELKGSGRFRAVLRECASRRPNATYP